MKYNHYLVKIIEIEFKISIFFDFLRFRLYYIRHYNNGSYIEEWCDIGRETEYLKEKVNLNFKFHTN